MSVGFSPCRDLFVIFASYLEFFRSLFSRAVKAPGGSGASAPEGRFSVGSKDSCNHL
jgi:hypothetical protein